MNRAELEEQLGQQRARRLARKQTATSVPRRRGRGWSSVFTLLGILFASVGVFVGMMFLSAASTGASSAPTATSASLQTAILLAVPPSTKMPIVATDVVVLAQVCTNIPEGRLRVHFKPGNGSEVRGYLAEGEEVQIVLSPDGEIESQSIQGSQWELLASPVEGWVNAIYICEAQQ